MLHGCADLRLAVVSPFVDRRHGTERALAELLERLAGDEHCEIHLYAQRVEDLTLNFSSSVGPANSGRIVWHKVPSIPGPHLLKFLGWLFLNSLCRAWDRRVRGLHFDLVLSPGVNCFDADVLIVHALFHRLQELARRDDRGALNLWFLILLILTLFPRFWTKWKITIRIKTKANYFATSTQRVSRITVTRICPGY